MIERQETTWYCVCLSIYLSIYTYMGVYVFERERERERSEVERKRERGGGGKEKHTEYEWHCVWMFTNVIMTGFTSRHWDTCGHMTYGKGWWVTMYPDMLQWPIQKPAQGWGHTWTVTHVLPGTLVTYSPIVLMAFWWHCLHCFNENTNYVIKYFHRTI